VLLAIIAIVEVSELNIVSIVFARDRPRTVLLDVCPDLDRIINIQMTEDNLSGLFAGLP
jgi:hypothetical protein